MNAINEAIGEIMNKSKTATKITDEDYIGDDGLLYCHKCNTPKQCRINMLGKEMTPYCLCKCEKERRDKEYEERKQQERKRRIQDMRRVGFPDSDMQSWNFDNDDMANEKITGIMKNYVEHFPEMLDRGKGLLLYGTVGTGKTFAAACVANALIDKGYPCLMTNFARLTNTITGMHEGKQQYIDSLNKFDLIVIDDLASERDTEYMGEIVQNIIDSRYRAKKPLIVTTNLTAQELKSPVDMRKQRIYSRLFDMCLPIEVVGKDRRKERLKDDFAELKDILGL